MTDTIDIPSLLQELELFADLKKGDLKKLAEEKHCQLFRFAAGENIVRQGELDTEFYVVLDGIASAYRTEDDGSSVRLSSFVAGNWFGEMSAISHQARSATVQADIPCTVVMLDVTMFQMLFGNKKGKFREMIDSRYKETALTHHLDTAPLFKGLSRDVMDQIAEKAELLSYANGDVLAEQGKPADAVYLVRSGIIKRTAPDTTGEIEVLEYLCDNSSFGERCLSDAAVWHSTYTTMSQVDLVRISNEVFKEVFGRNDKTVRNQVMTTALRIQDGQLDSANFLNTGNALSDDQIELLVGREAIKGTEALVIDLKKCTRCNACVESCVAVHDDGVPRLSKRGIRVGEDTMLSSACYNCKIPECMLSCKFGAIRRDVDGQIHIVVDNCVGCSICESHCPYGVIRMAHVVGAEEQEDKTLSFLKSIPFLNKMFKDSEPAPEEEPKAKKKDKAKAIKCDLCAGLPFEACVYNCPCAAISRQSPEALKGSGTITM